MLDPDIRRIQLEVFEGPLDLLLHLIQKNELDITTVSLSAITSQYLEYLDLMQELNIELAGEFLLLAAELARLKSRSLLPELDEEDVSDEDEFFDEARLVERLRAYQQFRKAAEALTLRPQLGIDLFARAVAAADVKAMTTIAVPTRAPVRTEDPGKLVFLYRMVLERGGRPATHQVALEKISVRQKMVELLDFLHDHKTLSLGRAVGRAGTKAQKIGTFLAVLELLRMRLLHVLEESEGAWTLVRSELDGDVVHYAEDFQ